MLSIKNLHVKFRSEEGLFHAVKGVNIELPKGGVIGIVGESGSGKSVTSLAIMRLHDPRISEISGQILFEDTNLLAVDEETMRQYRGNKVSMIFQEPMTSLNPVFSCGYQVAEAIRLHQKTDKATARKRTIELFNEVQLPRPEQLFDSYPHQLSGGQKQRVMIAMALSCDPQVLIADEPTTALDVTVQKTILQLLRKLKDERNMSMIFISHDLGVINEVADHVVVMYKGEIVEQAPVSKLFRAPQHPYTKGLLACRPSLTTKLKKLPVIADFINAETDKSIEDIIKPLVYTEQELETRKKNTYSQPPVLRVENLRTWFPNEKNLWGKVKNYVKAVDDVSFDVFPGETLGLVGESGCGKSTLGRSILRLIEPHSGSVSLNNVNMATLKNDELRAMRRNIQLIFQDPYSSLDPRITVGQAIMEPLQVHKVFSNDTQRKEKVMSLLKKVELRTEHFNRYPHEFSGGQRQRIVIARALALQPQFIICDESVSALDVSVQAQVLNLLRELQAELGLTYIFISHDLSVVKHISDRMIVMNKGKIEEMGFPDEIYRNPASAYTQKLIESIPNGQPQL